MRRKLIIALVFAAILGSVVYATWPYTCGEVTSPTTCLNNNLDINGDLRAHNLYGDGSNLTGISGNFDTATDYTVTGDWIFHGGGQYSAVFQNLDSSNGDAAIHVIDGLGVYGLFAETTEGEAVKGVATTGQALFGTATSGTGVYGQSSTTGSGVYGVGASGSGTVGYSVNGVSVEAVVGNASTAAFMVTSGTGQYETSVMNVKHTGAIATSSTLTAAGAIRGNGGFKSSDGSSGLTQTFAVASITTITVKNGLITAIQ